MRERPILFTGAMVRAILSGLKPQTRRAAKLPQQNPLGRWEASTSGGHGARDGKGNLVPEHACIWHTRTGEAFSCPLGEPGDRLWVRETWMDLTGTGIEHRDMATGKRTRYAYGADSPKGSCSDQARKDYGLRWRPSIHMPRDACRLVLEITAVRVERLQAISEADAVAEGLSQSESGGWLPGPCDHPEWAFHQLWAQVYGEPAWQANPWVWVIEFKRVEVAGG